MMWKVLLVEDEVFVRESIKEIIEWEKWGFTVIGEVGSGTEALEIIKNEHPHLVITDIVMPEMDGIELLKRAREAGYQAKFVMLTCMNDLSYAIQAMEYGASSYILKLSMNVADLRNTLDKISSELQKQFQEPQPSMHLQSNELTSHPEINKIITYIHQHYDQDITVKMMARYVIMSENYVSALFRQKTGKNLIRYLHEIRINKAKQYLETTDYPVNEIGHLVGFANDNYFIRIFKRFTKQTPSQYREQFLKAKRA